ncbi:MAG: class I SAM-dependent methyltransferase [Candidatus Levybacteria bacterium]|nr:class I SAM-dependent methyltransferase [Candidatus Levybacteria bacterium]
MSNYYDQYWSKQSTLGDGIYKWPTVIQYIPKKPRVKILDYGCGPGVLLRIMKKINSTAEYYGADVSGAIIKKNKRHIKFCKFFTVEDGKRFPFQSNFFDFIVTTDAIEHVYDTELAFKEFARILKPGGKILITTPYHGMIKNLLIVLTNFELIFDPLGPHIRFFTKKSLSESLHRVHLIPITFDYFGRFFPLSRGFLVLAKKQ